MSTQSKHETRANQKSRHYCSFLLLLRFFYLLTQLCQVKWTVYLVKSGNCHTNWFISLKSNLVFYPTSAYLTLAFIWCDTTSFFFFSFCLTINNLLNFKLNNAIAKNVAQLWLRSFYFWKDQQEKEKVENEKEEEAKKHWKRENSF